MMKPLRVFAGLAAVICCTGCGSVPSRTGGARPTTFVESARTSSATVTSVPSRTGGARPTIVVESARTSSATVTNDTGRAVNGLRVQAQGQVAPVHITLKDRAPHCAAQPQLAETDEGTIATFTWTDTCVQPGDVLTVSINQIFTVVAPQLGSVTWLQDGQPIVSPSPQP